MESTQAICPARREEVTFAATGDGERCLRCGAACDIDDGVQTAPSPATQAHTARTGRGLLLAALPAPAVIACLAARCQTTLSTRPGPSVLLIAMLSSGVAAIWLVARLILHRSIHTSLGFLLAPVFCIACLAGCALSRQRF